MANTNKQISERIIVADELYKKLNEIDLLAEKINEAEKRLEEKISELENKQFTNNLTNCVTVDDLNTVIKDIEENLNFVSGTPRDICVIKEEIEKLKQRMENSNVKPISELKMDEVLTEPLVKTPSIVHQSSIPKLVITKRKV